VAGFGFGRRQWGHPLLPVHLSSFDMTRKKVSLAWDRRIDIPVSRPGSWSGDQWLGDMAKKDTGWDSIELGKLRSPGSTRGAGHSARR